MSSLLSYAKLKGGICEYAYSPALAEKLHDPKVFALINLDIQKRCMLQAVARVQRDKCGVKDPEQNPAVQIDFS